MRSMDGSSGAARAGGMPVCSGSKDIQCPRRRHAGVGDLMLCEQRHSDGLATDAGLMLTMGLVTLGSRRARQPPLE
jgi:hypothetical protein